MLCLSPYCNFLLQLSVIMSSHRPFVKHETLSELTGERTGSSITLRAQCYTVPLSLEVSCTLLPTVPSTPGPHQVWAPPNAHEVMMTVQEACCPKWFQWRESDSLVYKLKEIAEELLLERVGVKGFWSVQCVHMLCHTVVQAMQHFASHDFSPPLFILGPD